ncbi:MAG: rod shape-determining protein MreD [Spirochaetaceae bacterium]|nr:MAG: rod shape-determining protein MreD [Spirochaetaceae bacterium]
MQRSLLLSVALVAALAIAQTVFLDIIAIAGVSPDLVLLVMIHVAQKQGAMHGQLTGLCAGLVEDLTSLAPLGFHSLLRLTIGFLGGLSHNKMFVDPIFVPIILVGVATVLKWLIAGLIAGVFGVDTVATAVFSRTFFIELGYNAVLAPLVFAALNAVGPRSQRGYRP